MNRIATLVAAALLSLSAPAHAAKYTIHWYLGHPNLDYFEAAAAQFKKSVETRSGGEIAVNIVTLDQDAFFRRGYDPLIAERVRKGEVEMGHSFTDVMGAVDPKLMAFDAPYLFRGYRHLEGLFEGPLGARMLEDLRSKDLVGLAFTYSGGAMGVATAGREIRKPEDLKGLKVGIYGDAVNEAWLKSLGATPVAIGHELSQLESNFRDGVVDAVVITWRNLERQKLDKSVKYFSLTGATYLVSITYVNAKFFDSLPKAHRDLIREESLKSAQIERAKTIKLNESAKRQMLAKGVRAVHLSQEGRRAFEAALKPAYEAQLERILGKDLLGEIRSTKDAAELPLVDADLAAR